MFATSAIRSLRLLRVAALLVLIALVAIRVFACGPFFPNTLLDLGDRAVLTAPEARFQKEIERMNLVPARFSALPATNYVQQTFDAELTDLRDALEKNGVPASERDAIVAQHRAERQKIVIFARPDEADSRKPGATAWVNEAFVLRPDPTNSARIPGSMPQIARGLPGEFADYFRGSIAWHLGKMAEARAAWTALLARPAAERPFKSTWAAYMLGKSWEEEGAGKAIRYFQQVRALAKGGFKDTLGLAASSLGWEARLQLRAENFAAAIDLYLEQAAGGERSAIVSLRWAAAQALRAGAGKQRSLARHLNAQRVVTAYVISGGWREIPMDVDSGVKEGMIRGLEKASAKSSVFPKPKPAWHTFKEPALRWLEAVESAGVKSVEASEQLALAAYQGGQMEMAQRWLKLAPSTPAAQWLRAKLLLRDGKTEEAAAILSQLVHRFPVDPSLTNRSALPGLAGSLYVDKGDFSRATVAEQLSGELGVFRLARRQFTESLDALLRSGYWLDAAYVAERVLTLDELKQYVDRSWPADPQGGGAQENAARNDDALRGAGGDPASPLNPKVAIRYLLARRLTRAERRMEARAYFPREWRLWLDQLQADLTLARDSERPPSERAQALFDAAKLTRHQGLELIGTGVEPDWQILEGNFEGNVTVTNRQSLLVTNFLAPTSDELQRAAEHSVDPEKRFHYRYRASALAWQAAQLMPDNANETARALCLGGTWIKYRDPKAADVFYKALVRRCRKTALGAEADRIRWFPLIDADGNLRPRSEQPLGPGEQPPNSPPPALKP